MNGASCAEVRDLAPEFSLSLLDGGPRATIVAHLDGCAECRAFVAGLRESVDSLVEAVPPADAPPGFEQRVLARLVPVPVRARRRNSFYAAAASVAAAVALILAVTLTRDGGSSSARVRFAPFVDAAGAQRGEAYLAGGDHPWVFMRVSLQNGSYAVATYSCQLVFDDGHPVTLGSFDGHGGSGEWGGSVAIASDHVVAARLLTAGGELLAAARWG